MNQREIKFRSWDKRKKVMRYGVDIKNSALGARACFESIVSGKVDFYSDREDEILMQFTGLKDDNGKEIYEGDIKKHHDFANGKHDVYVVKYGQYPGGYGWFEENAETKSIHSVNLGTGKIIGNIYENPELLKHQ